VAGREKDSEFLAELVRHHLLDEGRMERRIGLLPPGAGEGIDLFQRWRRIAAGAKRMNE
jgi:hypothetical protein